MQHIDRWLTGQQQYSLDHIPALFVATKSDLDLAQQRHEVQPDVYCRRLGLSAPMAVSARSGQSPSPCGWTKVASGADDGGPLTNLWTAVTRVALNPYVILQEMLRIRIIESATPG